MQKKKMREADVLNERIQLCASCSILGQGKFQDIPRQEMATHLDMLTRNGVSLPFHLRCLSLERQCDDLLSDLLETDDLLVVSQLQDKLVSKLVWSPGEDEEDEAIGENHVTAGWMIRELNDDLSTSAMMGKSAASDSVQARKENFQAHEKTLVRRFS